MREYGKIKTTFWRNPKLRRVSERARYLAAYLIACPHGNAIGCFELPPGYISADLGWPAERVSEHVRELVSTGFINYDERTFVVRLLSWWQHNTLENRNVAKGAVRVALSLPDCVETSNCINDLNSLPISFLTEFRNELLNAVGNTVEPPEPEPEPEPEPSAASSLPAARAFADAADENLDDEFEELPATRREKLAELTPHHREPNSSDPLAVAIRRVVAACANSPNLVNTGRVKAWLDTGADLDLDVLPAIKARLAKKPAGWSPNNLNYFDQAIADWKAERTKPMPTPRAGGDGPSERPPSYDNMMVGSPEHKRWLEERGLA